LTLERSNLFDSHGRTSGLPKTELTASCSRRWRPIDSEIMQAVDTGEAKPGARRKLWTREEASKLIEIFPGERYELIQGELIGKMGQKPPHAYVIAVLNALLGASFPRRIRMREPAFRNTGSSRFRRSALWCAVLPAETTTTRS